MYVSYNRPSVTLSVMCWLDALRWTCCRFNVSAHISLAVVVMLPTRPSNLAAMLELRLSNSFLCSSRDAAELFTIDCWRFVICLRILFVEVWISCVTPSETFSNPIISSIYVLVLHRGDRKSVV